MAAAKGLFIPRDAAEEARELARRSEEDDMLANLRAEQWRWDAERAHLLSIGREVDANKPFPRAELIERLRNRVIRRRPILSLSPTASSVDARRRAAYLARADASPEQGRIVEDLVRGRAAAFQYDAAREGAQERQRKEQGEFMREAGRELALQGGSFGLAAESVFAAADKLDPPRLVHWLQQ